MTLVHTPQLTGKNHGRPWCEAVGDALISKDDDRVTCPRCRGHLLRCGAISGTVQDIDFFGEGSE